MSESTMACSSVTDSGSAIRFAEANRDPRVGRLQPGHRAGGLRSPEERRSRARAVRIGPVTLRGVAGPAVRARAATDGGGDHHPITGPETADLRADRLHHAHPLVPQHRAGLHPGHGPADHVQVGAADRAHGQSDDRVGGLLDARVRDVLQVDLTRAVSHHCLHRCTLPESRRCVAPGYPHLPAATSRARSGRVASPRTARSLGHPQSGEIGITTTGMVGGSEPWALAPGAGT